MTFVFVAVAACVIGAVAALAARRWSPGQDPEPDRAPAVVPDGPLTAEALRSVELGVAVRGYRMDEVDALIARMESTLNAREQEVAAAVLQRPGVPAGPGSEA